VLGSLTLHLNSNDFSSLASLSRLRYHPSLVQLELIISATARSHPSRVWNPANLLPRGLTSLRMQEMAISGGHSLCIDDVMTGAIPSPPAADLAEHLANCTCRNHALTGCRLPQLCA